MSNTLQDAKNLIDQGRLVEAEDILDALEPSSEDKAELYYQKARIVFKQDNYQKTIDFLDKSIQEKEDDSRFYELLGQAYGFRAQQAGAVKGALMMSKIKKAFEKALQYNPQSLTAKEGLYMFYLFAPGVSGGDEQKAMELLKDIQEMDEARGAMAQAIAFVKKRQVNEAMEWMGKAADEGRENSDVQLRVGRFFLEQKQYERAEQCFDQYIQLKPQDAAGYNSKGELLMKKNALSESVNMFTQAIEKNPYNAAAYYNRAEAWVNLGEIKKAKDDYHHIATELNKTPIAKKAQNALNGLL